MISRETDVEKSMRLETWRAVFAYLPVRLCDGRWVWWETYYLRYSNQTPGNGPGIYTQRLWQRALKVPTLFDHSKCPPPPPPRK